jgi:hypothetical protein
VKTSEIDLQRSSCIDGRSREHIRLWPAASLDSAMAYRVRRWDLKYGLLIVAVSMLWAAIDRSPAYALSSWECAGVSKLTNTCDNVAAYFHVCYGWNGEFGTMNMSVPSGESRQIRVQQYSTFIYGCGVIAPIMCPAGMGPLPLEHCD